MPALKSRLPDELLVRDVVTWVSDADHQYGEEWAIVSLPEPRFVQRIRFRNGAGLQHRIQDRGIRPYSARYRELDERVASGPPSTNFGNPVNYVPLSDALMCGIVKPAQKPLRGAWTTWRVPEPVLTDQIAVICHEPGSVFSAIAEIELYGAPDTLQPET